MSSFLVDGKLITDKKQIREMWADDFGELGTPSENTQFDSDFLTRVTTNVQEIFTSCTDDPSGVLSGPLQYEEVARVCSQLKPGVCGVLIDYEHVKFAGPDLWILMQDLYQTFFESCIIPESLKSGIILPLFKGKGAKANNKDNYRGITLFPTLCKIDLITLQRIKASFLKCSLAFRRVWVAPKHLSLFLKQLLTCLSAVARCSAAFLMFVKPLIQSG